MAMRSRLVLLVLAIVLLGSLVSPQEIQGSDRRIYMLEYAYQYIQHYYVEDVEAEKLAEGAVEGTRKVLEEFRDELAESDWERLIETLDNNPSSRSPFRGVENLYRLVLDEYRDKIDPDEVVEGALAGMMGELDPYSNYMNPERYEEMQREMEGEYGGIGILITLRDERATVVEAFDSTPGYRANLKPGDVIMEVNGESTEGMILNDVSSRIRGPKGTQVNLTIFRPETEEEFDVDITRETIEIPNVTGEMKENNIGYISIMQFMENTGEKVAGKIYDLKEQGADKFILDLRGNPGGLLKEAVNVASLFMPRGPVVHVADRSGIREVLETNPNYRSLDLPLVVLVDLGSASGSEIVAAGIQEQEVGTLIGESTFGKATVQSILPLPDGSALRLTTARYYTSKQVFIEEDGVEPDIIVERSDDLEEDNQLEEAIRFLSDK